MASDGFIFKYLKNWLQMELCSLGHFPGDLSYDLCGGSSDTNALKGSSTVLLDIFVLDQHTEPFKLTR